MSASLLVLAAGLGTRFKGGIKQLTPVGAAGELLMEYSVYDAVQAGFDKVIFIIRRDIEQQFKELIGEKISRFVKVEYCIQDTAIVPEGCEISQKREKPWGTVHAVLAAKDVINGPFLIVNADDYYGKDAYKDIYDFLADPARRAGEHCMSGFVLKNTLSANGTVTRGICSADDAGKLVSVTETYKIFQGDDGMVRGEQNGALAEVDRDSIVSMNMWGFGEEIVPLLESEFTEFVKKAKENGTAAEAELALPMAADRLIKSGEITVKVLSSHDKWYGMTQQEDLPEIVEAFEKMTAAGEYPSPLFE